MHNKTQEVIDTIAKLPAQPDVGEIHVQRGYAVTEGVFQAMHSLFIVSANYKTISLLFLMYHSGN
jgi:hypothetical protein